MNAPLHRLAQSPHLLYLALSAQGFYYLVTGLWPVLSISSFMMVTGPKTDLWLVRTVGLLIAVIGAALLCAAWRRRITLETVILAGGCILSLTAIDIIYVANGTLSPIYLLDAVAECILLGFWYWGWQTSRIAGSSSPAPGPGESAVQT